jgi:hypothetical protein
MMDDGQRVRNVNEEGIFSPQSKRPKARVGTKTSSSLLQVIGMARRIEQASRRVPWSWAAGGGGGRSGRQEKELWLERRLRLTEEKMKKLPERYAEAKSGYRSRPAAVLQGWPTQATDRYHLHAKHQPGGPPCIQRATKTGILFSPDDGSTPSSFSQSLVLELFLLLAFCGLRVGMRSNPAQS